MLNVLLADMIALYFKTKNFHWHVSGPHFRDYHLLLNEQSDQIFATTDDIAERVRKIGGSTLRSIGHVSRLKRIIDNDADYVTPMDMLAELLVRKGHRIRLKPAPGKGAVQCVLGSTIGADPKPFALSLCYQIARKNFSISKSPSIVATSRPC